MPQLRALGLSAFLACTQPPSGCLCRFSWLVFQQKPTRQLMASKVRSPASQSNRGARHFRRCGEHSKVACVLWQASLGGKAHHACKHLKYSLRLFVAVCECNHDYTCFWGASDALSPAGLRAVRHAGQLCQSGEADSR